MSARYYVSSWNENEKYIRNTPDSCEVIQLIRGELTVKSYPSPYPPSEEDFKEISAQEYNLKKEEAKRNQ